MTQQKVIITNSNLEINGWIEKGWVVKMIVAQHVASSTSFKVEGDFCFLLEKDE